MGFIGMYFHLTEAVIESLTVVLPPRSVLTWAAILNQDSSWFPWKVMSHLLTVSDGSAKLAELSELGSQSSFFLKKSRSVFVKVVLCEGDSSFCKYLGGFSKVWGCIFAL